MRRLTLAALTAGLLFTVGCGNGQAQNPPWADWQVERDDHNGDATYSPDLSDEEAPRIRTVLTKDSGQSGDPYEDLQAALALLWLDMNEVEAVDVSQDDRLVVWGDVETEHGARRFAAALAPSADGPMVTSFVATEADFEEMGGPGFVGGDPAEGQPLDRALASGAAALQPGAMEQESKQASAKQPDADASVPVPDVETKEDGTTYIPGWEKDGEKGFTPWPDDAASPRLQFTVFEVDEVSSPKEAAAEAIKEIGLKRAKYEAPQQIPSYAQLDGYEGYVTFGTGRAGGEKQRFALLISKSGEDGHFVTRLLHAPTETYASWDGVMAPLTTFILVDDLRGAFGDPKLRQQMREASPEEEAEIFVQVAELNISYIMQYAMMSMMQSQQAALNMMQQMNNNIATETSCILTSGCQIEYDGLGNAQMAPEQ